MLRVPETQDDANRATHTSQEWNQDAQTGPARARVRHRTRFSLP